MTEIDYVIAQSEQIVIDFEKTKRVRAVTLEEMQAVHTSEQIAGWLIELKILRSLLFKLQIKNGERTMSGWITDRTPTQEECEQAGDTGFILCLSGRKDNWNYDHAIVMTDNFYDNGWYVDGVSTNMYNLTIHGWMMPPAWEEPDEQKSRKQLA